MLNQLRKNNLFKKQAFKINIKKNIPHGSGLGGASSNAADLLNHFNSKMKSKLSKDKIKKIANQIGLTFQLTLKEKILI